MNATQMVYLDNNATTPLDPRVLEAMMPYLTDKFGNAASVDHPMGWAAAEAVEKARDQVAALIGASSKSIIFTSGATESDNLAIKGVAEMYAEKGNHIITVATEHKAVLDPCKYLEGRGYEVTYLPVDEFGCVSPQALREAVTDKTILITIMAANNETGTLHPVAEIGKIAKDRGVLFHCDAAQAVGKIPVDVDAWGVDLLSVSAHKMYGPKGVGCLFVRERSPRVRLTCQMHGGGHERGMRSGTLNVPGIVGMGAAAELAAAELHEESERLRRLRDRFVDAVMSRLDHVKLNGHPTQRLPNTAFLSFAGAEGEAIITGMIDVAASTGSACTTATHTRSHVLAAMGVPEDLVQGSVRFSLGRFNTQEQIDHALERLVASVTARREVSGFGRGGEQLSKQMRADAGRR